MKYDKKFVFTELFLNESGKTSGSGFIGVLSGVVATIAFVGVMVGWWMGKSDVIEIFDKVLQLGLLSAALLGVRKFSGALMGQKSTTNVETESSTKEENNNAQTV